MRILHGIVFVSCAICPYVIRRKTYRQLFRWTKGQRNGFSSYDEADQQELKGCQGVAKIVAKTSCMDSRKRRKIENFKREIVSFIVVSAFTDLYVAVRTYLF